MTTFRDRIVGLIWVDPSRLKEHPENWRRHPDAQRSAFRAVLEEVGIADAVLAFVSSVKARGAMLELGTREERAAWLAKYKGGFTLIDGHLRREEIGQAIPTLVLDVGPEDARKALATHDAVTALAIADKGALLAIAQRATFANDTITAALAAAAGRYELPLPALPAPPGPPDDTPRASLAERFGVPPFSVLSAREGWWQARKATWIGLGIESEGGRETVGGANVGGANSAMHGLSGRLSGGDKAATGGTVTSIFDPVLCELAYRWFCPPGGTTLDPFAGGSVRGIVAAALGRSYTGVDLRPEQIAANEAQWRTIAPRLPADSPAPSWLCGDSLALNSLVSAPADFVFSCPPYADLERYSDDPRDLSTMPYDGFRDAYRRIITASIARLRADRFACFVVGEVRDARGFYVNLVGDTVAAFEAAGARFYNEAILVTACGSLPIRAARLFEASRKLGKTHQNVLVFCKGDPKKATAAIGAIEFGEVPEEDPAAEFGEVLR